ncbi:hypothetical protein EW093_17155 (plasmid) [Thiospirochaeta perfilievii]|uniref:Reverse transcriptase domain-containing protein n=1 Tax=Thiospirochaeta perfilievii TaxID=252967 RepID=A0A5C1QIX4_9SPIO|nr:reverse transcriptase domain-containing protein [Thiospirochaeta perfilievii]QEN06436.1 hypothetical protein EW093_17155 [Thiospirochaeta perfilievii]
MRDGDKEQYYSLNGERLFYSFLQSYSFNKTVMACNCNKDYWKNVSGTATKKQFKWIDDETIKKQYKYGIDNEKIGVPQGGALSGLIANIVLHFADYNVLNSRDPDLLYVRFCDDIILIHPDNKKCKEYYQVYVESLFKLNLFEHIPDESILSYKKSFWSTKTKICYKWANSSFPWIGFVGYEINRFGDIRVRKGSLLKEIEKQQEWVKTIHKALENGNNHKSKLEILSSVRGKLIGMAVGRPMIYNYDFCEPDMCWVTGFKMLNNNKYVRMQLRQLDRSRNIELYKMKQILKGMDNLDSKNKDDVYSRYIEEHFGKPYSYYYHALKDK